MARIQKKKSAQKKYKIRIKKTGGEINIANGAQASTIGTRAKTKKSPGSKLTLRSGKSIAAPVPGQKLSWIQKSIQFLREVKVELKKVTWPSRKQTLGTTVVVLMLVILISLFLGLVDMGLTSFVRVVLQ